MPTKKTIITRQKRTQRTGGKATARKAAGRTAKAKEMPTPEVNIRRAGPRSIAQALYNRGPAFWGAVRNAYDALKSTTAQTRQVMPRTNGHAEATH